MLQVTVIVEAERVIVETQAATCRREIISPRGLEAENLR